MVFMRFVIPNELVVFNVFLLKTKMNIDLALVISSKMAISSLNQQIFKSDKMLETSTV